MVALGIGEKISCGVFLFYVLTRFFGCYIAGGVVTLVVLYQAIASYRKITIWKRLGVPAPPGWIFLGNLIEYLTKGTHHCDVEWSKKYGPMFGAYMDPWPELIITDKELLKRVLVKDFHNFTNRREIDFGNRKTVFTRLLSVLKDDDWKHTRSAISPAFTSGKLKNITHLMDKCIRTFVQILKEQGDQVDGVEVKTLISNLTLDIIAASAFALDTDSQRNPDNQFVKYTNQLANVQFRDWRVILAMLFPWTVTKLDEWFNIQIILPGLEEFYVKNLGQVIKERRSNPLVDHMDFLQLMINAAEQQDENSSASLDASSANHHQPQQTATSTPSPSIKKNWKMNDFDIIANAFIFLVAGQETTAASLNFALYLLAMNPEVQTRAFDEIRGKAPNGEPISYDDALYHTQYLDAVIAETLRLYPAAIRIDRNSQSDYQLNDQLTIPKGTVVCVPVFAIHRDPENFENPDEFDPQRFVNEDISKTNPFIYMPFGYGPRNCIGMRFAQLEMKLILANVLRMFEIKPIEKTPPWPLELDNSAAALKPKVPIRLQFVKRTVN